jgi:hypothetical protein
VWTLLFFGGEAEILSALGQMALCQHLWSEIRNSVAVLVGRIFEASVWTTREWISKLWAKTIEFFLDMVSIIIHCVSKYKVSIILIIILNSIFKNILGANKQSSPLTLKPWVFFYKLKKIKKKFYFLKILKISTRRIQYTIFTTDNWHKNFVLKAKLCPTTWIWTTQKEAPRVSFVT